MLPPGPDPPAVTFFYSPDRSAKHPEQHLASYAGLMQADAYAGFNRLYSASRKPGPITEVACWSHARHNFFDLVRLAKAPIAIEAVKRIDELFAIEREINGLPTQERLRVPLLAQPSLERNHERTTAFVAHTKSLLCRQAVALALDGKQA